MKRFMYRLIAIAITPLLLISCSKEQPAAVNAPAKTNRSEAPVSPPSPEMSLPEVVVTVNDNPLTREGLKRRVRRLIQLQRKSGSIRTQADINMQALQKEAVQGFIGNILLRKEAERRDIAISGEEIEAKVQEAVVRLPESVTLDQALEQSGITLKQFKDQIRNDLILDKFYRVITTDGISAPTDEAVNAYYEANKARFRRPASADVHHILKAAQPDATDEETQTAKQAIGALRDRILAGEAFEAVAKEASDCPSAADGGQLPKIYKGQGVFKELEDAAFSQKIDKVGDIIKSPSGFHLVKVTARTDAGIVPFEEIKDSIKQQLLKVTKLEKFKQFIDTLKDDADIQYSDAVAPTRPTPPALQTHDTETVSNP